MKNKNRYIDYYSTRAKREGYAARSVYKLMEIQHKYTLIQHGHRIVDLGAAPGSWSQYIAKIVGATGVVYSVDLKPMHLDVTTNIRGDIFDDTTINYLITQGPYNGVLSDAAPSTTGNKIADVTRSFNLVSRVIEVIPALLCKNGYAVIKCLWGSDFELLHTRLKMLKNTYFYRPRATRNPSREIFLVICKYDTQLL